MGIDTRGWTEFVRRFGDLPVAARTSKPIVFGDQHLVIEGWYALDDHTLNVEVILDDHEGDTETLVVHEHTTLTRDDYAFNDVRDALAETLAVGVRAHFSREAAP